MEVRWGKRIEEIGTKVANTFKVGRGKREFASVLLRRKLEGGSNCRPRYSQIMITRTALSHASTVVSC